MLISFLFLNKNICCGYSLEAPRRGASNEYPQHMYSPRNKKNFMWMPPLICSYAPHEKMYYMTCLPNEDSDKPVYPHSLTSLRYPPQQALDPWVPTVCQTEDFGQSAQMHWLKTVFAWYTNNMVFVFYALKCLHRFPSFLYVCVRALRFYGPVNPMGSCRARSVYLTTRLLGRFSPLSG